METQKAKVIVNKGSAPFQLSRKALDFLGLTSNIEAFGKYNGLGRMNPSLIKCVELMKDDASSGGAHLIVQEVNTDEPFTIEGNLDEQICYRDHIYWLVAKSVQPKS